MIDLFARLDQETQQSYLFCWMLKSRPSPAFRPKYEILAEQQNHRCCYCGVRFLDHPGHLIKRRQIARWFGLNKDHPRKMTIEHVKRRVDGGEPIWENEVAACYRCNTRRGDIDAFVYFEHRLSFIALKKKLKRVKNKEGRKRKKAQTIGAS